MAEQSDRNNMHNYVRGGDLEGVKKCLASGVNIKHNDEGYRLVAIAVQYKHLKVLECLIGEGADVDRPDGRYWDLRTPLYLAASLGQIEAIDLLLGAGSNVDGVNARERPLIAATRAGNEESCEHLLGKGANLDLPDENGQLPIYWAAKTGNLNLLRRLFPRDPTTVKSDECTGPSIALLEAMETHDENILRANVECTDGDGWTALHLAANSGHHDAIKALLKAGSDVNALDTNGRSPLLLAATTGKVDSIEILIHDEAVNLNIKDTVFGQTALSWVAETGQTKAVKLLVQAGSDVNCLNRDGQTPLILAAMNGHLDSIQALRCSSAVDINFRDKIYAQSAVSYAAEKGHTEIVKLLIEAECEIYSLAEEGYYPPLERAAKRGNPTILQLFFEERSGETIKFRLEAIEEALRHACSNSYSETKGFILGEKRYLTAKGKDTKTVLSWAAENGDKHVLEALLPKYVELKKVDDGNPTALSLAAKGGHHDIASLLLEHGASVESKDTDLRTPLSWAAASGSEKTVRLLLKKEADPNNTDSEGHTPLSWAAREGYHDIASLLLGHGASAKRSDTDLRTPLSWAAASGSKKTVQLLLENEADPNSVDNKGRTSLSWAAESGRVDVVRHLLLIPASKAIGPQGNKEKRTTTEHDTTTDGQRAALRIVNIDSKETDHRWTPLWYAAQRGHIRTTKVLLDHGADPLTKDAKGRELMEQLRLDEEGINVMARREIRKMLEPFVSLAKRSIQGSTEVDNMFSAMVMSFLNKPNISDMELESEKRVEVGKLLAGDHPPMKDKSEHIGLRWLHLPANNMRWIEILITRHYEACGDNDGERRNLILKSKLWSENQHIPQDKFHPGRFMRAGSFILPPLKPMDTERDPKIAGSNQPSRIPSRTVKEKSERGRATGYLDKGTADLSNDLATYPNSKRSKSKDSRVETCEGGPELHRGFVLFMPYLHWECQEEVDRLKSILDQKRDLQRDQKSGQKMSAEQEISMLNGLGKLLWIYLDEDHPLHIRRTLDQFYYPNSSDIHDRDNNQTALRYFNSQGLKGKGFKPVLTMVDQLWMWVLPKCGVQPPTIITAFPERSNRDQSKWLTALVNRILIKCDDLTSRTCYEVADLIAAECSRIYLDSTSNRKEPIQFLEIYRTSIGNIMGNNATRVGNFLENIEDLKRPTTTKSIASREQSGSNNRSLTPKQDKSNKAKPAEVLEKLLDIQEDIEDLREIKDIQDELSIMTHLFGIQKDTIEEMHKSMHQATRQKNDRTRPDQLNLLPDSYAKEAIKRNVQEVERLEQSAEKAVEAIEKLLELKQKQADLLLTGAIYKINDATDKQGKTLLTFTVVTIIFLPSSFMASFLALNVSQFPWTESIHDSKLPLNWVVKTILSVSLPLSIVLLLFAFYLNASLREKHIGFVVRWISLVISWAEKQISPVTSWAEEQILLIKHFVEVAKMLTITGVLIGVYELCKASVDGLRNRERCSGRQDEEVGTITASAPEKGVHDQGSV